MKKIINESVLGILIIALIFGFLAIAPASASKNREPVDRVVFIHYPKGFENRPDVLNQLGQERRGAKPEINCPDPNTCRDYKYSGIHWASMPVNYVIDPRNGDSVAESDIKAAIETGFGAWNSAELNAVFSGATSFDTITGNPASNMDEKNSFLFRDISAQYPNALAVTFVWYYRFSKTIAEADTVFNDAYSWSYTDPATVPMTGNYGDYANTGLSSYDVGNIATHEQGHWLMLNDLYNNRDSELTMYGYGAAREMKKISLGLGDKLGIRKIY